MSHKEPFRKLTRIPNIDNNNATISVALASFEEDDPNPIYRSLKLSTSLAREFGLMAKHFIRGYRSDDIHLLPFDGGYKPDIHEIEWVSDQDPWINRITQSIPQPHNIPLVDPESDFVDHMRYYMVVIEIGNDKFYFFRRYGRTKELTRSNNMLIRMMGDRYEKLVEPTFQFDDKFDAAYYNGYLYSFNKANFQYIFRYYIMLRQAAIHSLDTISALIPFANFEEFKACCLGHTQKQEKLRNILLRPYINHINMDDIKRTIEEHSLVVEVIMDGGQEKIVFDKSNKWAILHLLDDAYVKSSMARKNYRANSKTEQ